MVESEGGNTRALKQAKRKGMRPEHGEEEKGGEGGWVREWRDGRGDSRLGKWEIETDYFFRFNTSK